MGWAIGKLDFYALPGGCKQTNQLWIIIAHQSFSQSAPLPPPPSLYPSLSVCLASAESASSFDSKTKHTTGQGRRQTAGTGQVSNAGTGARRKVPSEGRNALRWWWFSVHLLKTFLCGFCVHLSDLAVISGAAASLWPSHHELHPHRLSLPMSSLHWNRYEQFPFRLQISCGNNRSNVPLAPHTFPASLSFSFSLSLFLFQTIVSSPSVGSMNSLAGYNTRMQLLLIHWQSTSFSRVESSRCCIVNFYSYVM